MSGSREESKSAVAPYAYDLPPSLCCEVTLCEMIPGTETEPVTNGCCGKVFGKNVAEAVPTCPNCRRKRFIEKKVEGGTEVKKEKDEDEGYRTVPALSFTHAVAEWKKVDRARYEAESQLTQAQTEIATLTDNQQTLIRERDTARAESEAIRSEKDSSINALRGELDAIRREREAAAHERDTLRRELETARKEREAISRERDLFLREMEAARKGNEAATKERAESRQALTALALERDKLAQDLKAANEERKRLTEMSNNLFAAVTAGTAGKPSPTSPEHQRIKQLEHELIYAQSELAMTKQVLADRERQLTNLGTTSRTPTTSIPVSTVVPAKTESKLPASTTTTTLPPTAVSTGTTSASTISSTRPATAVSTGESKNSSSSSSSSSSSPGSRAETERLQILHSQLESLRDAITQIIDFKGIRGTLESVHVNLKTSIAKINSSSSELKSIADLSPKINVLFNGMQAPLWNIITTESKKHIDSFKSVPHFSTILEKEIAFMKDLLKDMQSIEETEATNAFLLMLSVENLKDASPAQLNTALAELKPALEDLETRRNKYTALAGKVRQKHKDLRDGAYTTTKQTTSLFDDRSSAPPIAIASPLDNNTRRS